MKRTFSVMLVFSILFIIAGASCKKDSKSGDDSNTTPTGHDTLYYFKYGNKKYEMDKAFAHLDPFWAGQGTNIFTVTLASKSVKWDNWFNCISGTGNILEFELIAETSSTFVRDLYTMDTLDIIVEVGELETAFAGINYDYEMEEGTQVFMSSGTCSVKKAGNDYEFTLNLRTADHKPVTAYYKGVVGMY